MYNKKAVEKNFNISIAPVRRRGGSLVIHKIVYKLKDILNKLIDISNFASVACIGSIYCL
jgi:hypothetical protein